MTNKYVFNYSKIKDQSLEKFYETLKKDSVGLKLKELYMKDLTKNAKNGEFIKPGNGVYIFKDEKNELFYVGKCSSRSFIERIPAHFDPREKAWFNSMIKHKPFPNSNEKNNVFGEFEKNVLYSFKNFSLILINFTIEKRLVDKEDVNKIKIRKVESLIRKSTNVINKTKNKYNVDTKKKIFELIQSM